MVYPKSLGYLQSKSLSSPPRLAWPHLTPGELPLLEVSYEQREGTLPESESQKKYL